MNMSSRDAARERDRLKSVPAGAAVPSGTAGRPSVAVKAALAALRIYKVYFSILFAGSCRFEPTCSRYAYEAIERFGVIRGVWMGLARLLRCQPLSRKFGYDPVPEKTDAAGAETGGVRQDAGRAAVTGREAHS
jgi:putative membrane protein insertion efficiency factor